MNSTTSSELAFGTKVLVLPLGAWEQHGPHLPLDTDTIIIEAVIAASLASPLLDADDYLVAPTVAITASDEHDGFIGGLSCGTDALVSTVVSICRSARWARGVCVVNGHGGNIDALGRITSALDHEGIGHTIWSLPGYEGGDMHAGRTETSLLLHIDPRLVRTDRIQPGPMIEPSGAIRTMRTQGVKAVSENGVLGDPTTATAEHGLEVLTMYTDSMVSMLRDAARRWPTTRS